MEPFGKGNDHGLSRVPRPSAALRPRSASTPPPPTRAPTPTPIAARPAPTPSAPPRAVARGVVAYGIRRAMELLRPLPPGERGALVDVVKMTLESVNVKVDAIVDDASKREAEIERRMDVLRSEVAQHEGEVSVRRDE